MTQLDKNGQEVQQLVLTDVTVTPEGSYNLFSLTKRMKNGRELFGDSTKLGIRKGDKEVIFDIVINTRMGALFCAYMKRKPKGTDEKALAIADGSAEKTKKGKKISVKLAHDILGHMGEARTRTAAKHLGIEITRGAMQQCESCATGKAKQKNVPKNSDHVPATTSNERIFLDISTIMKPKSEKKVMITKKNWRLMVDEHSGLKFSDFFETKDGMIVPTCEKFEKWRQNGHPVKFVRCDNAGENLKLESVARGKDWKLNLSFEYTGKETPQRNHLAEVGFSTLGGRGRAMMRNANVPLKIRYKVCKEALMTATRLDGLTVVSRGGKLATRYEHWMGAIPKFASKLRTWGEAGVVKIRNKGTPKIADRGVTCMFVGYNADSGDDVYRMWNPKTNRMHRTRDIIWLKRMFFEEKTETGMVEGVTQFDDRDIDDNEVGNVDDQVIETPNVIDEEIEESDDEESDDEDDDDGPPALIRRNDYDSDDDDSDDEDEDEATPAVKTRTGRSVTKPTRLIEQANLTMTKSEANYCAAMITVATVQADGKATEAVENIRSQEFACVGAGIGGGFQNTKELRVMKYKEAMSTKDTAEWEAAVDQESDKMDKHTVFEPTKREDVPANARIITSTWAMKKKANGTFRARLNARGFQQQEGVHYDAADISSPVTNDMSIRTVMVLALMAGWTAKIIDVKGAFLHGEFDEGMEPVYMAVPEGFEKKYDGNVVLKLLKTIYGLKNAAKAFWKELLRAFKAMGCERSDADPCMYYKWTALGLLVWLSWIDDCASFGAEEAVEESRNEMMEMFDCDDVGTMDEYVGCEIRREKGSFTYTQPVMLQSFSDEFDLPTRVPITPGDPGKTLSKAKEGETVSPEETTYYRRGVGKLLHMMRWSRPEIYNAVRDLSRHMSAVTSEHIDAMHRVMAYCVATPLRGWQLKPVREWDGKDKTFEFRLSGRSDSDYGACKVTRRSVSGTTTYLEGAPIAVKSSMQKTVALSVTEAELMAAVSCAQDMLYAKRILESMGLKVALPMKLEIDNKGAVDLINNWSVGGRTRHVETRQLFLRGLKEQGIFQITWVSGDDNEADLFTKNLPGPLFNKHRVMFNGEQ